MEKLSDIGAERAVLAALFNYGTEVYVELSDIISHSTFTHKNNQILYKCIERCLQTNPVVDIPSLLSAAKQLNLEEVINTDQELSYISSLMDFPAKKENALSFALKIKKFEFARTAKKTVRRIEKEIDHLSGDESIDDIISLVENPLADFLRGDETGYKEELLGENVDEYLEYLVENKCDQIGLTTGMPRFDAVLGGGLRRKCVDLVSARPGVGKSLFADHAALTNARLGIPVLMLDTEMGKEDHLNRIASCISGVPLQEVSTGKFADDEEKYIKVKKAFEEISSLPYTYVSVAGMPFESIINIIKRWLLRTVGQDENGETNDCLVVYDYLKLMSSSSITNNIQEYQALGFQITSLHNLTVKYDFPCLAFVQLNRDGITKESTDAVSGSDRLIWLCTSFSIFKAKSQEEVAEDGPRGGNRKLVTLKARHGPGLMDGNYININMIGANAKLVELRSRDEMRNSPDGGIIEGADLPFDENQD